MNKQRRFGPKPDGFKPIRRELVKKLRELDRQKAKVREAIRTVDKLSKLT